VEYFLLTTFLGFVFNKEFSAIEIAEKKPTKTDRC
jgi:hypothetical protein